MDALTREPEIEHSLRRPRRWVRASLCVLATAAIGAVIWLWPVAPTVDKVSGHRDPNAVIPIVQAVAEQRDMPVWLDGLGTVQAFQTVTVKSMVDGPLVSVNFKEGQQVHTGDVLARIDPRIYQAALDNAVAKKALDEANLANARLDLVRYQKLVVTNYATQQQSDTQRAMVAQLEAQVRQDQAQIDTAQTQLSYTDITSPLTGRVGIRLVDQGNIVHATDTGGLLVITQLQPISVVFSLPQQTLSQVAAAIAHGSAVVEAYPEGTGAGETKPLDTGTLTVLDNQIDQTTGTIKLKATFPNAGGTLWPGGFVGVRLRVDTVHDATVIPRAAVQRGPRRSFVYVIGEDSTVRRQPVTVGYEDELGSIVTEGLAPGDRVVIDGASRLTEGAKVSIAAPLPAEPRPTDRPAAPGARRRDGPAQGG
jgi:membrane fusion protein, multidrug efflux system